MGANKFPDTTEIKVGAINTSVGATTDSASATGSINAKLKDIKAYIDTDKFYSSSLDVASSTGSAYTIVNVSGQGMLSRVGGYFSDNPRNITITIDGVATSVDLTSGYGFYASTGGYYYIFPMVRFNASLLIQATTGSTDSMYLSADYTLV